MVKRILVSLMLLMLIPVSVKAADWYAGHAFVYSGDSNACVIVRFKSADRSFTLAEADGLFNVVLSMVTDQELPPDVRISSYLPSRNHADNVTGDSLANIFLSSGTRVCLVGGEPVDMVAFISAFRCEYQNQNQMCFRIYVDLGELDLTQIGVPKGPSGLGGVFVRRELWDTLFPLLLRGGITFDLNADAVSGLKRSMMAEQLLGPVVRPIQSFMPR